MFMDALLLVSDAQAITATAVSTNTIDLGNVSPNRQIGTGRQLGFGISVDVAADATTGDETYTFEVIQSASADLSSPTVISSRAISRTLLTLGSLHFIDIPSGSPTQRYLGLRYTVGGTTPTITVTAWLTDRELFSIAPLRYSRGYTV